MARSPELEQNIAAQIARDGYNDQTAEPDERHYRYIAERVADHPTPVHHAEDDYQGRGHDNAVAMARLHVYRHLIDELDSYPDVERHLQQHESVVEALGLEDARSRETIRRSWNQQFAKLHSRLRSHALDLRDSIGWGRDGVLAAMGVDDDSQSFPEFSEDGIRESAKADAYERVRPILTDIIDFERADNVSVPAEDLTDYAGWLARNQDYAESMDTYVSEQDLDSRPCAPETFRRAVRNKERHHTKTIEGDSEWVEPRDWSVDLLNDPGGTEDWHSTTEEGITRFVEELHDEGVIDGVVPVCIDASIRPWHKHPSGADNRPDGVYREAYFDTNYGYKDVTASAIVDGRSVVLANVSKHPGDDTFRTIKYLIDRATDLVDVSCFYADAEYANVDILRYIHHIGEDYIFRKPHRDRVKELFEEFSGTADYYTSFTMNSTKKGMSHNTNLFAVEKRGQTGVKKGETRHDDHSQSGLGDFIDDDDNSRELSGQVTFADLAAQEDDDVEYVAFVTNRDIDSEGIDPELNPKGHDDETTVWGHAERYRQRWSIETTFRQVKYQFLAATRSRDLGTRRFVWMLALLLYNGWAVANVLVQHWAPDVVNDDGDPPVRAKVFLEELARTEHG